MISVRSVSGRRIDLSRPRAEDFVLDDIATGLSHVCRFAGQVREFYSVAQHAVFVAAIVPDETKLKLHALHHDDSEAFMGDLSRHLKHHPLLAGYRALEGPVQAAIERALQLAPLEAGGPAHKVIKLADDVAALYEHIVLRQRRQATPDAIRALISEGFVRNTYEQLEPMLQRIPACYVLTPMPSDHAKRAYLNMHESLKGTRS